MSATDTVGAKKMLGNRFGGDWLGGGKAPKKSHDTLPSDCSSRLTPPPTVYNILSSGKQVKSTFR